MFTSMRIYWWAYFWNVNLCMVTSSNISLASMQNLLCPQEYTLDYTAICILGLNLLIAYTSPEN
jgi:hypothetical protein